MALLKVSFYAETLKRTVPVTVVLPGDRPSFLDAFDEKPLKTLYLLHGYLGSCEDWASNTRIRMWAEENNLAVVMPSGDNSFYIDQPVGGNDYGRFTGEELVSATRRMFPLSKSREDTFIAGLSMGGFGALRNGLMYNKTFGCVASLSGAFRMFDIPFGVFGKANLSDGTCFGDADTAAQSDKNPSFILEELIRRRKAGEGVMLPKIYMACGAEDELIECNRHMRDYLVSRGVDITYEEGAGIHDWNFWDEYIQRVLKWLPL